MPQAAEWHGQAVLECLLVDSVVFAGRQSDHFNPGDLRAPLGRTERGFYPVVAANRTALGNVTERSRRFLIPLPERATAMAGRPDTTQSVTIPPAAAAAQQGRRHHPEHLALEPNAGFPHLATARPACVL